MFKKVLFTLSLFLIGSSVVFAAPYSSVTCGDVELPLKVASISSTIITILQISVPIILIVVGMLDFMKAVMSQKDDDIKKGTTTFIKRVIVAILVFFVVAIVKLVIGMVADTTDTGNMFKCIDCFTSYQCG